MTTKLMIGAAAGLAAFAGIGVAIETRSAGAEPRAPFMNPALMMRSMCGKDNGLASRRAFFLRSAAAYADLREPTAEERQMTLAPKVEAIHYDVTTSKPEAQAWFDQGLAYTYNFNHGEAIKAFRRGAEIDPDCAMCYWGEAFALGPNINAPMEPEAVAPAYAAVERALGAAEKASEKERALINALAARYAEDAPADRSELDAAFADAMDGAARAFPEDDLIAVIAAEANMDAQPWDYWADGGRTPKGRAARTLSLLEGVIARNPDYPPAIHLYIHITEASSDPYRAAPHADRLAALTPGLGHLVHMPSHTYYRTGRFADSLAHNIDAVAADEAYLETADASILYEFGYFTHNLHFAMTSALMAGDGETAVAMAKKLDAKLPLDMATAAPWIQPIKAAPYYAMVQFAEPVEILAMDDPGPEAPFLQGAWRYARGAALAAQGNADAARAEAEAIGEIVTQADLSNLTDGGVPALDILNIARLTVIARAAAVDGDLSSAIEAMEEATALQDSLPYTEPPYWYYPAKQTLAAYLLQDGQSDRAEQTFIETLAQSPNNAWVLAGLAETYRAQGDRNGAKFAEALFKDAWAGGKKAPALKRL